MFSGRQALNQFNASFKDSMVRNIFEKVEATYKL